MAKKETLNPITAFRKANEARKAVVMKSLKKAQEGIQTNSNPTESDAYREKLVNDQYKSAVKKSKDNLIKAYDEAIGKNINRQKTDALNQMYPNYKIAPKKKGGSVKSKKK